jgi:hypothetical protein
MVFHNSLKGGGTRPLNAACVWFRLHASCMCALRKTEREERKEKKMRARSIDAFEIIYSEFKTVAKRYKNSK